MADAPRWSAFDLPERVLSEGYERSYADAVQSTAMDAGNFKTRLKTIMAAEPVQASIFVDAAGVARFRRFFREVTKFGALPFWIPDQVFHGAPITNGAGQVLTNAAGAPLLLSASWLVMFAPGQPPREGGNQESISRFPLVYGSCPEMAKLISVGARQSLIAQHSADKMIGLIRITPVGGGDVIRFCTDAKKRLSVAPLRYGTVSRDETYDAMAMRLLVPGSSRDELPSTSLEFDNIDPGIIQAIQTTPYRASMDLEVVLSSAPDEVVETWPSMLITDASFDEDVVTLQVGYGAQGEEPAVMHRMTVNALSALRGSTGG